VIRVFDTVGEIFAALRDVDLGVPIWRVTDRSRLADSGHLDLAILAAYGPIEWDLVAPLGSFDTLVLTARFDPNEAFIALSRGLSGYIDLRTHPAALRAAVLGCLAGETGFGRMTVGRWLREWNSHQHAEDGETRLTTRQRQVLHLVAQGLADKEIGEELGIATVTAQKHVTNILDRLEVPNRAAAVAAVCGLLSLTPLTRTRLVAGTSLAAAS
jgi:DNA-binding CsgD family transcriptional regulator